MVELILLAMSFKKQESMLVPVQSPGAHPMLHWIGTKIHCQSQLVAVSRGEGRSPTIVYHSECRSRKASPPAVGVAPYRTPWQSLIQPYQLVFTLVHEIRNVVS